MGHLGKGGFHPLALTGGEDDDMYWQEAPLDESTLGGQDSNPLRQDQNLLCYRLHHPPKNWGHVIAAQINGDYERTRSSRTPHPMVPTVTPPPKELGSRDRGAD